MLNQIHNSIHEQTCLVFQATLKHFQLEEADLIKEIEQVEAALKEEEAQNKYLKRQNDVCSANTPLSATRSVRPVPLQSNQCLSSPTSAFPFQVFTAAPERNVYFNGQTADAAEGPMFDMESRIVYPMDGGTVLVTFEEEMGECSSACGGMCVI